MVRSAPIPAANAGAPVRRRLLIATVVWGDWYCNHYLKLNLPSLLSPGNLPRLAMQHDVAYLVMTRAADIERLRAAPAMQHVAALVPVEFRPVPEHELAHAFNAHRANWDRATDQARRDGRMICYLPPDVMWSDGSFGHVGELISRGKNAIMGTFMRVLDESFAAEAAMRRDAASGALAIAGPELVELSLAHVHPLMAAHLHDSPYFPYHPEMVVWPVPGEGLSVRCLAREILLYDPARIALTSHMLIAGDGDPDTWHVLDDSDTFFAVSLAPLGKDIGWHLDPVPADPVEIATWWLTYDSPANGYVSSCCIRWHFRAATQARWQRIERRTAPWVARVALLREGVRAWRALMESGSIAAATLLATALRTGLLARALAKVPPGRSALILVPDEAALVDGEGRVRAELLEPGTLAALLARHVVPDEAGTARSLDQRLAAGEEVLRCADGTALALRRDDRGIRIGGAFVVGPASQVGRHRLHAVDTLLEAEAI